MAEVPQAMINPAETPGGAVGGAGQTGGMLSSVRNWFQKQDPNFWRILAGSIAQSAPPGSWQHQLGKTGAGMARGQIMAKAMEKQRAERRKEWGQLLRLIRGEPDLSRTETFPSGLGEKPEEGMEFGLGGFTPAAAGPVSGIRPETGIGFGTQDRDTTPVAQRYIGGF